MEEAALVEDIHSRRESGVETVASVRLGWKRVASDVTLPGGGGAGLEKIVVNVSYPTGGRTEGRYELVTYRLNKTLPAGGIGGILDERAAGPRARFSEEPER